MPKEPDYTITTPEKMRRTRRLPLRLGAIGLVFCVVIPTFTVLQARWGIFTAVSSAAEVRLEEYSFGKVLTSRTLAPADFSQVTEAMPITVGHGFPGMVAACFIPHHRIVIVPRDGGASTTIHVCFGCEQFSAADSSILPTPFFWQRSLRQLFVRHDVPIRESYPFSLTDDP